MISIDSQRRSRAGFSLVELLVVISIMLLLAAIALPRMLDAQKVAYEAAAVSFLNTLKTDQESYRLANGTYADNFDDLGLVARGPKIPGEPFAPEDTNRLAALLPRLGDFQVYAAQGQQPPAQNPPPTPPGKQKFGRDPKKGKADGSIGGAAPPGIGGSGGGSGGLGPGGSGNPAAPGQRRKAAGAGGGALSGGGASGGATAPQAGGTGGGTGGASAPLSGPQAPGTKTNRMVKHNYVFSLQRLTPTTWSCTVVPVRDRGDSKFFYIDQTGVIRSRVGKPASSDSPQI